MPIIRSNASAAVRQPAHGSSHPTREAQVVADRSPRVESTVTAWQRPTALDAPEPRPGMVQRWIRADRGDGGDQNWLLKYREGWRPRPPGSVADMAAYTIGKSATNEDVIRVGNLILCEMPENVFAQRQAYYSNIAKTQVSAKPKSEDAQAEAQGAAHGFSKISHDDQLVTSRGRTPPVMMN